MSTLIISLPNSPASASTVVEYVRTEDGLTPSNVAHTQLALLHAQGAEVVVLVPVRQLSWHVVSLPRGTLQRGYFGDGGTGRLRAILEGLLEERLLDEPSGIHFALEPRPHDGLPVRIAACSRAWLQEWIAVLEQAKLPVSRIVPELAPQDGSSTGPVWTVSGTPENPELVRSDAAGVCLLPLGSSALALLSAPTGADSRLPVYTEPGVAAQAEKAFGRPLTLQTRPDRALAAAQSGWDLAQFDLLRTRGTRTRARLGSLLSNLLHAPQWRAARWSALALVAVQMLGLQAWAWKEQSALEARQTAIQTTLTSTFPDIRVVVDAPLQMARAVADMQRQSGAATISDLEVMLGSYQAAAPEGPAPAAIEFVASELQLKGLDAALPALADVTGRLQARGYSVRWDGDALVLKPGARP